jgi:S1-C subfamily serine protease
VGMHSHCLLIFAFLIFADIQSFFQPSPAPEVTSAPHDMIPDEPTSRKGAFLGVRIVKITLELAKEIGFERAYGALVVDVFEDTTVLKAGILKGDIILELNGAEISEVKVNHYFIVKYFHIGMKKLSRFDWIYQEDIYFLQ